MSTPILLVFNNVMDCVSVNFCVFKVQTNAIPGNTSKFPHCHVVLHLMFEQYEHTTFLELAVVYSGVFVCVVSPTTLSSQGSPVPSMKPSVELAQRDAAIQLSCTSVNSSDDLQPISLFDMLTALQVQLDLYEILSLHAIIINISADININIIILLLLLLLFELLAVSSFPHCFT